MTQPFEILQELEDEDDLYDELENEFVTHSVDKGDYDMFVVYVKGGKIGIRTAWHDGFEVSFTELRHLNMSSGDMHCVDQSSCLPALTSY